MNDSVKVNGPVKLSNDSRERVAFDLMSQIYMYDVDNRDKPDPKEYVLKLYEDCLKVVKGASAEQVLSSRKG